MTNPEDDVNNLSEIYEVLRHDAKSIINDLQGGITMWREAAAGAIASMGFIIILIVFYFQFSFAKEPIIALRWATVALFIGMAVIMAYIGVMGMVKYFQLRRKYKPLFEKAKKLD